MKLRCAKSAWMGALGLLFTGCYLSHGRDTGAEDAGGLDATVAPDTSASPDAGGCCGLACGDEICDESSVCTPAGCSRSCERADCGALCCAEDEVCGPEGLCQPLAVRCDADAGCDDHELCDELVRRCVPRPATACALSVPPDEFDPVVQWEYVGRNVWSTPLVVQLTDDDGDGVTGVEDTPDVVVVAADSYLAPGQLVALSGDDGRVHWASDATEAEACRFATPAAGDLDGDGTVEIVAIITTEGGSCTLSSTDPFDVGIFSNQGELLRRVPVNRHSKAPLVALGDFDADGTAEIFALGALIRADGEIAWRMDELNSYIAPSVGDLDGDGRLEIAATNLAVDDDGSVLWRGGSIVPTVYSGWGRGSTALARIVDVPSSAGAQVVAVNGERLEVLDGATGEVLLGPIVYSGSFGTAGPPTVADFDADGNPEIGVAGENEYVVFDFDLPSPHIRWTLPSHDFTPGSVGSTVFDFDGDGAVEVVFGDECHLQIVDGREGRVIWKTASPNATLYEYPVVADVDRDGNAEIVAVSNLPADEGMWHDGCRAVPGPYRDPVRGVRVFRDRLDHWVPTRSVWNQHAFHVDNVEEDGSIPRVPPRSWESHNTFRQNRLSTAEDAIGRAPDLIVTGVSVPPSAACGLPRSVRVRVENAGSMSVPGGVPVAVYGASDEPLGVASTAGTLVPGGAEWVDVSLRDGAPVERAGLRAVVDDDGTGEGVHTECDERNNRFDGLRAICDP